MEVRLLVRRAPEALGEETAVPLAQRVRPLRLIHVQRFAIRRIADVVKLEIRVGIDPHGAGRVGMEPRLRQRVARQIDFQIARLTAAEVGRGVERIRLGVDPAVAAQRKPRHMAGGAADLTERPLADRNRPLDRRIARNHAPGHLQRRLPHAHRGDVGDRQFIPDAVTIGIGAAAKPLRRLDAVMLVERGVGEFANGDDVARLVPGTDNQRRWMRRVAGDQAQPPEPLHLRCVPHSLLRQRQRPEADPFGHQRFAFADLDRHADSLQLLGHLPREHLQVARAEHACGAP